MADVIFGGIEGGGSSTSIVLVDASGHVLVEMKEDVSTNHFNIGLEECARRLINLTNKAKNEINFSTDTPIKSLGLTLSGGDNKEACDRLTRLIKDYSPNLSERYFIACDTVGTIAAASKSGGIVLIAGTGSSGLLMNPDGQTFRCGGWGHMLGDEGSAYWVTQYCLRILFNTMDGLVISPYDTTIMYHIMCQHFNVKTQFDMLEHMYTNFKKERIASACEKIAQGAHHGDQLCQHAFTEAGKLLAYHVCALLHHADESLFEGGLKVICTGSVWKSWDLLKSGFIAGLTSRLTQSRETFKFFHNNSNNNNNNSNNNTTTNNNNGKPMRLILMHITGNSTMGAAYLASEAVNQPIPFDREKNTEVFFSMEL
ncbi:hypothetical protein HELRODRAFT_186296 [Helobdella robusta]|uniref:N-acetyl-D-glucosamine kinase n=1 Tax=Helobdella robusta TaxID=6412 RepID=T1FNY0_HELRO|nr:hypothetical protein HELRODRAFT_186296 [Helobdella robusta]ESO09707.1 hypothetical protein HELRODRAFT_186296 [Helobdella robusta]